MPSHALRAASAHLPERITPLATLTLHALLELPLVDGRARDERGCHRGQVVLARAAGHQLLEDAADAALRERLLGRERSVERAHVDELGDGV